MDITAILNILVPIVLIAVGIALVVFIIELTRMVKTARTTIDETMERVNPMLANIEEITDTVKPAVARVDPLVERVQLTLDAVNLEMMRVDEILEDVAQITDTASSATAAVDTITNAPVKAVSNVATRMRAAFGSKNASDESAQLAEERTSVEKALEDYKAAEKQDAQETAEPEPQPEPQADPEPEPEPQTEPAADFENQTTGPIPVDEVNAALAAQAEAEPEDAE